MARQSLVLAVVCAIGGAVVAALLMGDGRDAADTEMAALQQRLAALERRVAVPQTSDHVHDTVAVREPPVTSPGAPGPSEPPAGPQAGPMPGEQAVPPIQDAAAAAGRRRYEAGVLEQSLAAQQIDVAATNTFAEGLKQAFQGNEALAGNQLLDAQCRATLCRIALLQRSDDDVESFLGSIGSLPGFENTQTYWQRELNTDGSSVMTMYVARQGHQLPDYEPHLPESLATRNGS